MTQRLFKRNGIYYGWVYDADGKRIQRSTKCRDKQAAEAVLRECERQAVDPEYAAASAATIERALEQLLVDRTFKGRAPETIASYRGKAGHVVRLLGAETKLARVDARAADGFIETRLKEGASRNTVHKELTVIRAALKLAKRRVSVPLLEHALKHADGTDGMLFKPWTNVRRDLAAAGACPWRASARPCAAVSASRNLCGASQQTAVAKL